MYTYNIYSVQWCTVVNLFNKGHSLENSDTPLERTHIFWQYVVRSLAKGHLSDRYANCLTEGVS